MWKGDEAGARSHFERARAVAQAEVQAHAYLGELELKSNPLAAAKIFTEALRIDPSDYRKSNRSKCVRSALAGIDCALRDTPPSGKLSNRDVFLVEGFWFHRDTLLISVYIQ
jgi:hypothetical protein